MLDTSINFGGKIGAIMVRTLFLIGVVALYVLSLLLIIDFFWTIVAITGFMLRVTGANESSFFIIFYVAMLALTLANVSIIVFIYVAIPYLVHRSNKYNWVIYMCNFNSQSSSDYLVELFANYIPIEIFSELKYASPLEMNLFEESLATEDYDTVELLLSYKHGRSDKFKLIIKHMNDNDANYCYIDTLLNNQYYLADIFDALLHMTNLNLKFVDALMEYGGDQMKLEDFICKMQNSNHALLLDHILTKQGPTDDPNILNKLNADLVCALNNGGSVSNVEILLKHGADPNVDNGSLIIGSAKQSNIDILKLLLEYGGDVTINDNYLFRYSIAEKNHTVAEYLANTYSFYNILRDGDNLVGNILSVPVTKNANNC